jgi:hypothetical protein
MFLGISKARALGHLADTGFVEPTGWRLSTQEFRRVRDDRSPAHPATAAWIK